MSTLAVPASLANQPDTVWIPSALILALIEEVKREWGWTDTEIFCRIDGCLPQRATSSAMGERLRRWRRGEGKLVELAVADRIVTRLVGPQAWHERPELAAWYERG